MNEILKQTNKGAIRLKGVDGDCDSVVVLYSKGIVRDGLKDEVSSKTFSKIVELQVESGVMTIDSIVLKTEDATDELFRLIEAVAVDIGFSKSCLFSRQEERHFYEDVCGYAAVVELGQDKGYFMIKDLIN